jgi:uncharacterized protein
MSMTAPRREIVLCVAILLATACNAAAGLAQTSPSADSAFTAPIQLLSGGATLRGTIYVAAGRGPHPTVVHLQGFPGSSSTEFEQYLQSQGLNAVSIHVRGQQTSDGLYSIAGMAEDASAVVAFLRSDSAQALRINSARIALVGVSAGTLGALSAASGDPAIRCVGAIVPFNWALAGLAARSDSALRERYRIRIATLTSQPEALFRTDTGFVATLLRDAELFDLRTAATSFQGRNIYLIGARQDETAPLATHFLPLVEAARAAPATVVRETVVDDTHNLPATWEQVFAAIARWLREECSL